MKICCTTRFDITVTGVTGHCKPSRMPFKDSADQLITDVADWNRSRNQQRNWETLTQLISLRTQITEVTMPVLIKNRWQFNFEVDNDNLFLDNNDPLSILRADCEGVPMLTGLNDVAITDLVLINDQNIWFTLIPINN